MPNVLRMSTVTGFFVAVAAIGHLANGGSPAGSVPAAAVASVPAVVTDVMPTVGTLPEEEGPAARDPALRLVQGEDCPITMSATRRGAGLARLAVSAPCRAGERLTIQHDALSFTLTLDAAGRADVEVPALTVDAAFFGFFDGAAGTMAELRMPEVSRYERAGVMWEGEGGLGVHASEFGAGFGTEGYVWSGAPQSASRAMAGQGGFITRLGDGAGPNAQVVEVYSYPAASGRREGSVEIAFEAAYGAEACGRDVTATAFRAGEEGVALVPVSLTLPDCDTAQAGGFVQLNGMLDPITLAAD